MTVALTMLASLTLLPALLGFIGPKVLSRRERADEESGPVAERSPRRMVSLGAPSSANRVAGCGQPLGVVVVALPLFTLHLGLDDAGTDPSRSTTRQAYDLLAKGFGPGFNGPFELVAEILGPTDKAAFERVLAAASHQPGIMVVTPPVVSPAGTAVVANLYPWTAPQAAQTTTLLDQPRNEMVPAAETGSGLTS